MPENPHYTLHTFRKTAVMACIFLEMYSSSGLRHKSTGIHTYRMFAITHMYTFLAEIFQEYIFFCRQSLNEKVRLLWNKKKAGEKKNTFHLLGYIFCF